MRIDGTSKFDHKSRYDSPACACLPIAVIVFVVLITVIYPMPEFGVHQTANQLEAMSDHDLAILLNTHRKQLDKLVGMSEIDLHKVNRLEIDDVHCTAERSIDAQRLATYRSLLNAIGGTLQVSLNARGTVNDKGGSVALIFSSPGEFQIQLAKGLIYSDTALTEENDGDASSGTRTRYFRITDHWYIYTTETW